MEERLVLWILSVFKSFIKGSLNKAYKKLSSQRFLMHFTKYFMQEEFATNNIIIYPPDRSFFPFAVYFRESLLIFYTEPWLLLNMLQHVGSNPFQDALPSK